MWKNVWLSLKCYSNIRMGTLLLFMGLNEVICWWQIWDVGDRHDYYCQYDVVRTRTFWKTGSILIMTKGSGVNDRLNSRKFFFPEFFCSSNRVSDSVRNLRFISVIASKSTNSGKFSKRRETDSLRRQTLRDTYPKEWDIFQNDAKYGFQKPWINISNLLPTWINVSFFTLIIISKKL